MHLQKCTQRWAWKFLLTHIVLHDNNNRKETQIWKSVHVFFDNTVHEFVKIQLLSNKCLKQIKHRIIDCPLSQLIGTLSCYKCIAHSDNFTQTINLWPSLPSISTTASKSNGLLSIGARRKASCDQL